MKSFKGVLAFLFAAAFVFVCGIGIAADKAEKPAAAVAAEGAADEGAAKDKKGPPKGEILYQAEFEEEDDTDAWSSDGNEIEWMKGGANGSKGSLKIFNPGEGASLSGEKYVQWYDAKTFLDCDYFVNGFTEELYYLAHGVKAGHNVRVQIKGWVKGKWGHAQCKAGAMSQLGASGKNDTFSNLVVVTSGLDKECKDPYILLDNIVITATDKKKEEAAE